MTQTDVPAFFVLWGIVLLAGGLSLVAYCVRKARRTPGWLRPYSVGGLVLLIGGFLALGGVSEISYVLAH